MEDTITIDSAPGTSVKLKRGRPRKGVILPKGPVPPRVIKRNEYGLIEDINYYFNDNGYINWKLMIPPEFLYVIPDESQRKRIEEKYGKTYSEIKPLEDKVDDDDLRIQLDGFKQLLKVRGFSELYTTIKESNEHFASVNCVITFLPNYETENRKIVYSDNGSAHIGSTIGFGQKYLVEMATNRAFARCIRNFLNISIISKEEVSEIAEETNTKSNNAQVELLQEAMKKKGLTFDILKEKMIIEGVNGAAEFTGVADMPLDLIFQWIGRVKKYNVEMA